MWFKCYLDLCGDSVEVNVLMCDNRPELLNIQGSVNLDISDLLYMPHVHEIIMKAYEDYIGE